MSEVYPICGVCGHTIPAHLVGCPMGIPLTGDEPIPKAATGITNPKMHNHALTEEEIAERVKQVAALLEDGGPIFDNEKLAQMAKEAGLDPDPEKVNPWRQPGERHPQMTLRHWATTERQAIDGFVEWCESARGWRGGLQDAVKWKRAFEQWMEEKL